MSDNSFFREVDEAVRQDRYKALLDRYGVYVLGLAVVLIVGVAAYKGWIYWTERQSQQAGAEYTRALVLETGADRDKAREAFDTLAKDGPRGYQVLSRFQMAAADAKAGETDKAVSAYDALSTDGRVDPILQDLATVKAATLRVDDADYEEMERRLKGLVEETSPWRFSARELLGLSAYQHKNLRVAEEQFSGLLSDQNTPPNLRERANMMLALIVSATPAQSSSTTN
ncbi:MAG: tetratricopeptide repeat protein [Alphaproteobacteria bacterium]